MPITYDFSYVRPDPFFGSSAFGSITVSDTNGSIEDGNIVSAFNLRVDTAISNVEFTNGPIIDSEVYSLNFGLEDLTSASWINFGEPFPFVAFSASSIDVTTRPDQTVTSLRGIVDYDGLASQVGRVNCSHIGSGIVNEDPECTVLRVGYQSIFRALTLTERTDDPGPDPTPVSEPSTYLLMGLGLLGLGWTRRKYYI